MRNVNISPDTVKSGIENVKWEGRLEVLGRSPLVVVDGAHNRASARALADSVKKIFKNKRITLVFGASKDKDVKGVLEELLPIANSIILTKSKAVDRAMDSALIEKIAHAGSAKIAHAGSADGAHVECAAGVEEALDRALAGAGKEGMILITGSLFIVADAKGYYKECVNIA